MGFHKRYINDDQVIDIYRREGCQAVIDWFTNGVDALILSGDLTEKIASSLNILSTDKIRGFNVISELISEASIKKGFKK
jgi:hypothetical protein